MANVSLFPKHQQTQLRFLMLFWPLFMAFPLLFNVLAGNSIFYGPTFDVLLSTVSVFSIVFGGLFLNCLSYRLVVKDGMLISGTIPKTKLPLSELCEVSGSTGSFEDDFKDSVILKFNDEQSLKLMVDEYDQASLRRFLSCLKAANPKASYSYSEVISLESKGLLQFLLSTAQPDSAIIKLSKNPLAETVVELIKTRPVAFWGVYLTFWVLILLSTIVFSMNPSVTGELSPVNIMPVDQSQELHNALQVAIGSHPIDFSHPLNFVYINYLRLNIIVQVSLNYLSYADMGAFRALWIGASVATFGLSLVSAFKRTFVFVDSQSIGMGMSFIRWERATEVVLNKPSEMGDPLEGTLEIRSAEAPFLIRINLALIADPQRKQLLLRLVERYAVHAKTNEEFLRATNRLVDIQFTDVWLQSGESHQNDDLEALPLIETTLAEGAYELESIIGYGGQGITHLARTRPSNRKSASERSTIPAGHVVIKELVLPNYADVRVLQDAITKFEQSAVLLQKLNHPQVVRLWDHFIENGRAYLVLEYIQGKTLREVIDETGPLSLPQVLDYGIQLANILIYLHSEDPPVIHCDLAPDNLILTPGETIKLLDFDVARVLGGPSYSFVAGRPSYTPPEQFRGKPTTKSDIFALGAILHFLLKGVDPASLGHSDHDPGEDLTGIEQLISRCLSFEESSRPASASEVRHELETLIATTTSAPTRLSLKTNVPQMQDL